MAPRTPKRVIALLYGMFVVGMAGVMVGAAGLVLSLSWYGLGPALNDPHRWVNTSCHVQMAEVQQGVSQYGLRWRALFEVAVPDDLYAFDLAALSGFSAWHTSRAAASADVDRLSNHSSCMCPRSQANRWTDRSSWLPSSFCLMVVSAQQQHHLLAYYRLWHVLAILGLVLGLPLVAVAAAFFLHTRCFRRRITCCRKSALYDSLN